MWCCRRHQNDLLNSKAFETGLFDTSPSSNISHTFLACPGLGFGDVGSRPEGAVVRCQEERLQRYSQGWPMHRRKQSEAASWQARGARLKLTPS